MADASTHREHEMDALMEASTGEEVAEKEQQEGVSSLLHVLSIGGHLVYICCIHVSTISTARV